jgi:hypothetical protein
MRIRYLCAQIPDVNVFVFVMSYLIDLIISGLIGRVLVHITHLLIKKKPNYNRNLETQKLSTLSPTGEAAGSDIDDHASVMRSGSVKEWLIILL